jgi:hypothetical protein
MKKSFKQSKPDTIIQMRNRLNLDVVYTSPNWPSKEIDGVEFIAVKLHENDASAKWMKKDNLEKIKKIS